MTIWLTPWYNEIITDKRKDYKMKNFIKQYKDKYGYEPSIGELYSQYTSGSLQLTDEQEDELITKLEEMGLM